VLLQEKAHQAPSVREATLEKQLVALQGRHDKLQHLCKLEKERHLYKTSQPNLKGFLPAQEASQREEELLDIIDTLKGRLLSTDAELRTLQKKLSEGEDYVEELKRKMKRVEQLEHKLEKAAEQALNDREYIRQLRESSGRL
jgi:TolA-binding protein